MSPTASSHPEYTELLHSCPNILQSPLAPAQRLGLVVKASASRAADPAFKSRLLRDFSGKSHTSDLRIGTPVETLPGAWYFWISAGNGTGWHAVSIL